MKTYLVKQAAWITGDYYAVGDKPKFHPDAVKMFVDNGVLEEVADAPAAAPKPKKS